MRYTGPSRWQSVPSMCTGMRSGVHQNTLLVWKGLSWKNDVIQKHLINWKMWKRGGLTLWYTCFHMAEAHKTLSEKTCWAPRSQITSVDNSNMSHPYYIADAACHNKSLEFLSFVGRKWFHVLTLMPQHFWAWPPFHISDDHRKPRNPVGKIIQIALIRLKTI